MHMGAHFCCKMMHCEITVWCIMQFVRCIYRLASPLCDWLIYIWGGNIPVAMNFGPTWLVRIFTVSIPLHNLHDDGIKWKHFTRHWSFVRGIHLSPVNSSHKGQWSGALMLSLICFGTNGWVNNRDAGVLRCHRVYYDVTVIRAHKGR